MIKLVNILKEGVEERKLYRQQAERVWNEIVNYIKSGGYLRSFWLNSKNPLEPEYINFALGFQLNEIESDLQDTDLSIVFGTDYVTGEGRFISEHPSINLTVFPHKLIKSIYREKRKVSQKAGLKNYTELAKKIKKEVRDELPRLLGKEIKEAFIHEYTHYIDIIFKKAVVNYENPLNNWEKYLNSPLETNARFQTALYRLEDDLKNDKVKKSFEHFRDFKRWFFEEYGDELEKNTVNDSVVKSYIKRLYKYWNKFMRDRNED